MNYIRRFCHLQNFIYTQNCWMNRSHYFERSCTYNNTKFNYTLREVFVTCNLDWYFVQRVRELSNRRRESSTTILHLEMNENGCKVSDCGTKISRILCENCCHMFPVECSITSITKLKRFLTTEVLFLKLLST